MTQTETATLTAVDAFRLGIRAGELIETLHREEVPGRVLEAILTKLVDRHDLPMLQHVVELLDEAEQHRAADAAALEERVERTRQEADQALSVPCETCQSGPGDRCRTRAGKTLELPHAKRRRAAHQR